MHLLTWTREDPVKLRTVKDHFVSVPCVEVIGVVVVDFVVWTGITGGTESS